MKGRKRKPTALRLVTGNPGKRPATKRGRVRPKKPRRAIPSPPEHLSKGALVVWGAMSVKLDRLGLMTELGTIPFEQLCEIYAEIIELRAHIKKRGRYQTVTTQSGSSMERARPAVAMLSDADRRLRLWCMEFGVTPSSLSRIDLPDTSDESRDPAAAYFG